MKLNAKGILIAAVAAVVVGPVNAPIADAQVSSKGGGYQFRLGYKKGQVMKYTVVTTATMPNAKEPMKFNMPMTMKVVDVQGDTFTIETTTEVSMPGQKPQTQKQTVKMDRMGNAKDGQTVMTGTNLPKDPVKVGGSWTAKAAAQGMNANAKYTLKGFKKVGGRDAAELVMTVTGTGSMKMTGSGTMFLDRADCSLLSMAMTMKMPSPDGKSPAMNMSMTMTRKQ